jgi:hypothetical protein
VPPQSWPTIGVDAVGFFGDVVAAHVGCDDVIALFCEGLYLFAPRVPEFWKTVQEEDERAISGLDVVETDAIDDSFVVGQFGHGFTHGIFVDKG